ncbi:hypothetical protein HGRIS_009268 [Hohenbuehelia grisea]|uniref:Equilibrative nucleoside transporter 1 n=1 Tax=Hohenbuehelia grisea TaxID=104357 RepID=A0ABR3J0M0_9AGAR
MSPSSPEALYHAIPQAPVAANPIVPPSEIELDNEGRELDDELGATYDAPSSLVVEARIRWIHFILGCAILLPWNVMITATPYFLSRLEGSQYKSTFNSYLSTSFTAANFAFLAHATATSKQTIPSLRIRHSTLVLVGMNLLLTLSTYFTLTPGLFMSITLLNGMVQAAAGSYLQTAVIQIASLFGPTAVQAMMTGQGAVGVAVSGVQVITAIVSVWGLSPQSITAYVSDGSAEERSAFIFFSLSTLFLVASLGAQAWLVSMPAYKAIAAPLELHKTAGDVPHSLRHEVQGLVSRGPHDVVVSEKHNILRVARVNIIYEIAVAYVFVVTLSVFPPITASVKATNPATHPLLFSAVHFLVFSIGDLAGRYFCSFRWFLIWSARKLMALSATRTLFIPLFLMCNVQRSSTSTPQLPIISSDFLFMFILLVFGFTNGHVSSLCMMSAPSLDHNPRLKGRREDVDIAATVASFCLIGGLAIGSVCSFAVRAAVCGCNPFVG